MSTWILVYGSDVRPVPDRMLLYLPGGMKLEQYHAQADVGVVYEIEKSDCVRSFIAPVYVSASLLDPEHHVLLQESSAEIEGMHLESETPLQVYAGNYDHPANVHIVNVPVRNSASSKIANVFAVDTASSRLQH